MLRIGPEPANGSISSINIRDNDKVVGILKEPTGAYSLDVSGTINCGALLVNGSTLGSGGSGVWDLSDSNTISYTNGNVGIGITSPVYELDVSGSVNCSELLVNGTAPSFGGDYLKIYENYTETFDDYDEDVSNVIVDSASSSGTGGVWDLSNSNTISYTNGNVGIGTDMPESALQVAGNIEDPPTTSGVHLGYSLNNSKIFLVPNTSTANSEIEFYSLDSGDYGKIEYDHTNNRLQFQTNSADRMTIDSDGNVGIGTTSPTYTLDVSGDIHTNGYMLINGGALNVTADASEDDGVSIQMKHKNAEHYSRAFVVHRNDPDTLIINYNSDFDTVQINNTVFIDGSCGIGTTSPSERLTINGTNNATDLPSLGLRNGNSAYNYYGAQIAFGYNGTNLYQHFIQTRHNGGGTSGNAIDFYVCDTTQNNSITSGVTHTMSLDGGNVGIGTTAPESILHIVESTGTSPTANAGTIILDHEDNAGTSSIVFRSKSNRGSDFGYIKYQDDREDESGERSLLTIGNENDGNDYIAGMDNIALMPKGYVGIGTTSPSELLTIESTDGTTDATFSVIADQISGAKNAIIYLGLPEGSSRPARKCAIIATPSGSYWATSNLHFCLKAEIGGTYDSTNASLSDSKMMITRDGNVGIGTTSPAYTLDVVGSVGGTSFTTTSDDRLKSNEIPITDALESLMKLNPMTYDKYDNMDKSGNYVTESGLISQEIWYQVPELRHIVSLGSEYSDVSSSTVPIPIDVSNNELLEDADYNNLGWSNTTPSGVKYTDLIAYLIKAVQELNIQRQQEKDSLQASHDSLKNELDELKSLLQEKSVI